MKVTALFAALLLGLAAPLPAQVWQAPNPPAANGVIILPQVEAEVLRLTNEVRRRYGFSLLDPDEALAAMARAHCADMLRRRFFSHFSPEGRAPKDRVMPFYPGKIARLGENIWKGFNMDTANPTALARTIVDSWMASPGHRDNIFCPDFTRLGVAVAVMGPDIRAAQLFVKPEAY